MKSLDTQYYCVNVHAMGPKELTQGTDVVLGGPLYLVIWLVVVFYCEDDLLFKPKAWR